MSDSKFLLVRNLRAGSEPTSTDPPTKFSETRLRSRRTSKTPQLVGRNRLIDDLEMYSIVRSRLVIFPQRLGRMPAVHWKRIRTRLEPSP